VGVRETIEACLDVETLEMGNGIEFAGFQFVEVPDRSV
jgi:hypothetical protein